MRTQHPIACLEGAAVLHIQRLKHHAACRYHLARKQIPSLHGPAAGVKLELFIFDPFPLTTAFALLEVARCDEFAPVKNAEGAGISDTPSTARAAVLELHSRCAPFLPPSVAIHVQAVQAVNHSVAVQVPRQLPSGRRRLQLQLAGRQGRLMHDVTTAQACSP